MTKYALISDSMSGHIAFYYNGSGKLLEFQINSWDITAEVHDAVLRSMPNFITDGGLIAFAAKYRYRLEKRETDLSYERFKKYYGVPKDAFKGEATWKKMPPAKRWAVFQNLRCQRAYRVKNPKFMVKYPTAYLNNETRDDWDKMPAYGN